jgi:magnesium transporter
MSPDDRVRLLDELPAKIVRRLLQYLSPEERQATNLLLGYQPETAGRIMTTEYVRLRESDTAQAALEQIRRVAKTLETIYVLYVTDPTRHITGFLSLKTLLLAPPSTQISDIMTKEVISVHTDTDQEEVAKIIQRYDFLALPVVDSEQRLVGIITVDDVIDILEAETTEDIYTSGGIQSTGDNYFQAKLWSIVRKRVVWLFVLLLTNTLTSSVISAQEEVLEQVVALTAFIPLLIDTGGNVGAQSSTVVIRGLNTAELSLQKLMEVVRREAIAGLLLGVMLGLVVVVWAYLLQGNWLVSLTVGLTLAVISVLASVAGSGLPFLFKKLNLDPALMSAPFITTAVDVIGVWVYLTIARQLLLSGL